jgi:hypothetical protein
VVADALASHEAGARECRDLKLTVCWAHVLRRFRDAVVDFSEAQFMFAWIQDLYAIDARATDTRDRAQLRSTESRAVTDKMKTWMQSATALKTTTLGSAIRYTLGIWSRLILFLDDPEIWLDNSRTERGLRGPVIGRRNPFRVKVRARHRRRRDDVQPRRDRQSGRRGFHRLPRRGSDAGEAESGRCPPTRGFEGCSVTAICQLGNQATSVRAFSDPRDGNAELGGACGSTIVALRSGNLGHVFRG